MNRRTILWLCAATVVAMIGLGIWRYVETREPILHGETLSWWLDGNRTQTVEFKMLLAEMDHRSVRYLIQELNWKPSPVAKLPQNNSPTFLAQYFSSQKLPDRRATVASVLGKLGSKSKPAIPALRKLVADAQYDSSQWGVGVLASATAALISLGSESLDSCVDRILDPNNRNYFPPARSASMSDAAFCNAAFAVVWPRKAGVKSVESAVSILLAFGLAILEFAVFS